MRTPRQQIGESHAQGSRPSVSYYCNWINNTGEGATESHTLINLDFFAWMRREYGLELDIYTLDAGNIDGRGYYGSMDSDEFRARFPCGFARVSERASSIGSSLGIWIGPDGFGDSEIEEQRRIDMIASLCRDYGVGLLKIDAVCSGLRSDKQDAVARLITECQKHRQDLIVMGHRVPFGRAGQHVTTSLWNHEETYIDVHMPSRFPAPHHRAGALARGVPPDLERSVDDHGVCLSSCLDYWDDDLVLQAFGRCFVLSPQIYGNPWFLRDDEFPRLARLFRIHRKYRDILVNGMLLPESECGPDAVSRGSDSLRFMTLKNLNWEPVSYSIRLDESCGLSPSGSVELRQIHPHERVLGEFPYGSTVPVQVLPFRSCLLMASSQAIDEIGIDGCDYEVIKDTPGSPVSIRLLGLPGTTADVKLSAGAERFSRATIDGTPVQLLADGETLQVSFPGTSLRESFHRKLDDLRRCDVPECAETLYEATCFAADNDALEIRSLRRSGETEIAPVKAARDAFLSQETLRARGVWDRYASDGDPDTFFVSDERARIRGGALRIDLGAKVELDSLELRADPVEPLECEASADLQYWIPLEAETHGSTLRIPLPPTAIRYVRFSGTPDRVYDVAGYRGGAGVDRSLWRATNLFASYSNSPVCAAWNASVCIDEMVNGAYLAVPIFGRHGDEGAYAALRVGERFVGSPDRSASFQSNVWEYTVARTDTGYTYYFPLTEGMLREQIDVFVIAIDGHGDVHSISTEVWVTAYPAPYAGRMLVLE